MFTGSLVALVTPMHLNGSIDYASLEALIEWHIDSKTEGLIIAGTTGENATLTVDEHSELLAFVIKQAKNRLPIIAGTGSYSTEHARFLTETAEALGADAALIVTPYYNKPTQNGLYEHYKYITTHTNLPIILYNVPSRTACDLLPETIEQLTAFSNIVAIKEATGKVERTIDILNRCGDRLTVLSGDDATTHDLLQNGAKGVISVTANVCPDKMATFCHTALSGQTTLAAELNAELMPLHQGLFVESNPIPVKWALATLGRIPPGIRLPLTPLNKKYHDKLKEILQKIGLLSMIDNI